MKLVIFVIFVGVGISTAQQMADPNFEATVARPAYTTNHPHVAIDQAHNNFHTKDGLFKPFADLLQNDGYNVTVNTAKFTRGSLKGIDVLVISNALGELENDNNHSTPAFTKPECDAVYDWVRQGGSLFLIADHAPMGYAAGGLAERLGVTLGKGFVFDTNPDASDGGEITVMIFSDGNHLLGKHPIIQGRNDSERLHRLVAFTGESVTISRSATNLLQLSPTAGEVPTSSAMQSLYDGANAKENREAAARRWPAAGRGMATAFVLGSGRVVINGEAGMLSAQVLKKKDANGTEKFVGQMGMNVPGNDDRQYVLNVLHWLSGVLK
jgi:hypothetical protein